VLNCWAERPVKELKSNDFLDYRRIPKEEEVVEETKANKAVFTNYSRDLLLIMLDLSIIISIKHFL
jgi:hypothetical protein